MPTANHASNADHPQIEHRMSDAIASYEADIRQRSQSVAFQMGADYAALAIARMDPHALQDMQAYLNELAQAKQQRDESAMRYLLDAIREILAHRSFDAFHAAPDLNQLEAKAAAAPEGEAARAEVKSALQRFQQRYFECKDRAGLRTQQQVAKAAGVSLSTIQAIETGRVRPQYRTVQALAEAFDVPVAQLAGDLWARG